MQACFGILQQDATTDGSPVLAHSGTSYMKHLLQFLLCVAARQVIMLLLIHICMLLPNHLCSFNSFGNSFMTCVNVCRSVQKVTPTAFLEGPASMQHINAVLHDMWGMGCLVFFMLTNHRLYNITGGSPQDMAEGTRQRHAQRDLLFSVDSSLLTTGPALINAAEGALASSSMLWRFSCSCGHSCAANAHIASALCEAFLYCCSRS